MEWISRYVKKHSLFKGHSNKEKKNKNKNNKTKQNKK